ncbi:MAG: hypothetical protein ACE5Q6_20095, partial [Dehalococcoidia bacterium]
FFSGSAESSAAHQVSHQSNVFGHNSSPGKKSVNWLRRDILRRIVGGILPDEPGNCNAIYLPTEKCP